MVYDEQERGYENVRPFQQNRVRITPVNAQPNNQQHVKYQNNVRFLGRNPVPTGRNYKRPYIPVSYQQFSPTDNQQPVPVSNRQQINPYTNNNNSPYRCIGCGDLTCKNRRFCRARSATRRFRHIVGHFSKVCLSAAQSN